MKQMENLHPYQIADVQFKHAADKLDLEPWMRDFLNKPRRNVSVDFPVNTDHRYVKMFTGYSLNTITLDVPTKVVRPTADLNETENVALCMTWKCPVHEPLKHNSFRNPENFLKNRPMVQNG